MTSKLAPFVLVFSSLSATAHAANCDRVVIAYYQGPKLALGHIYYERFDTKFWAPGWSYESVVIEHSLDEKFPMDELVLSASPCDKKVWLYPVKKKNAKIWDKLGKIAKPQESQLFNPSKEDPLLLRVLSNEWVREGTFHILFHLLGW